MSKVLWGSEIYFSLTLLQVAIAKSLGLLALRMSDAVVVPLNTTQYALELDDYLDVYVSTPPFTLINV